VICPTCNKDSSVIDTRLVEGVRYRRRKCGCLNLWVTVESVFDGPWPYKDPRVRKYKPKPRAEKAKPRPKLPKKKPLPVFTPAVQQWNLVVTKESPLWLKNIAMQLG
jgi:hypothetical protein